MNANVALWCSRLARQPVTLEVDGSSPFGVAICGCSSSGRAPPCQGGGSEFEPRHPLHKNKDHPNGWSFVFIRGDDGSKISFNCPVDS